MPKGLALTIGLNSVEPQHYGGWSGDLNACEADAHDMEDIVKSRNFTTKKLLTKEATRSNVISEISAASKSLVSGDIFMLSYSGHGGQVPDLNNEEDDYQDETWCLYDGELIDDEIYRMFGEFAEGVRILVFSDSCHSGTVIKAAYYHGTMAVRSSGVDSQDVKYRCMPPDIALRTYRQNREFYDEIQKNIKLKEMRRRINASVLLISGCQDNQYSSDGVFNGLFTATLLRVWNNGNFKRNYRSFHKAIVKPMPPDQTPNYFWVGKYAPKFEAQVPFTI
ncbi:MAG: caspase family protein [candidate division WOR-3 bacterium]|nr:caspase family protein [candidate division WOR-3 bacterium]